MEAERPGRLSGIVPDDEQAKRDGDQEQSQPGTHGQEEDDPGDAQFAAFFLIVPTRSEKVFFLKYCVNWLRYFSTCEGLSPTLRS